MKLKILTLLSVFAVALGVRAAQEPLSNRIGFENFDEGYKIDVTCDDSGQGSDVRFWQSPNNDQTAIVGRYLGTGDSYVYKAGEPKLVDDGPGDRYLTVESSVNSIYRTSVSNIGFLPSYASSPKIGDGIFIDTLMEFSAIDGLEVPVDMGRAKIMVWLGTNGGADTNLYVTAGSIGAYDRAITPTNFKLDVDIEPDSWHRLTVRAIDNIITDEPAVVGFEVFIDAQSVACAEASAEDYETAFGGYLDGRLNATAKDLYAQKRLFPSLIAAGTDDANVISAAGFNGVGKIDDLSIVDYVSGPAFAQGGVWTLKWTKGVKSLTLNGDPVSISEDSEGLMEVVLDGLSAAAEIGVEYAEGYGAGTWTTEGGATLDETTFTITAANAICTIVAKASASNCFDVDGTLCSTLSEAIKLASGAGTEKTIKLTANFNTADETEFDEYYNLNEPGTKIVLDLNGCTLTNDNPRAFSLFVVSEGISLTIIDSVGVGKIVSSAQYGAIIATGAAIIGREGDTTVPTFDGLLCYTEGTEGLLINAGRFDKNHNSNGESFLYPKNMVKGRICELQDGYWTTVEYVPPASVNFTATFGEGIESATMNDSPLTTDPVEVDFETTYTIEPTLKPWYVDATISTSEGITPDGLSFTVDAGAEAASATISATNAKDSPRSASELAELLGITDNPEAIADDTRFKAIATWAQDKGYLPEKLNKAGFNREYLLNGFEGEFKITSIAVDSTTGVITIGKPEPEWKFNGVLHVQGKALLTDDWSDCSEPIKTENGYNFFRLELRFE